MRKLIWKNSLGDEINLTKAPFGIINWEGFSNAPLNIQSQQVPMQDGSVFLDALIENRDLSVTLSIQDGNDLEKRYELERQLIHILNPKLGEGYLIYTNDFISKRIKCIPQIPLFPNKNSNDPGTQKGELSWVACEPYWEDLDETSIDFDVSANVTNEGDVPIQVKIDFRTSGVTDATIINNSTKQKLQIKGEITNDVNINTNVGQKTVKKENYDYISLNFKRNINNIIYIPTLKIYMGICHNAFLFKSKNCIDWEYVNDFNYDELNNNIMGIVYNEKERNVCVIGYNGYTAISSDSTQWNYYNSGLNSITDVKYITTKKKIYALSQNGYFYISEDGINWIQEVIGDYFYSDSFCYAEDMDTFIVCGYGKIIKKSNGGSWEVISIINGIYFLDIIYIQDINYFILVGQNGKIFSSMNGSIWNEVVVNTDVDFLKIGFSARLNKIFIVGYNSNKSVIITISNIFTSLLQEVEKIEYPIDVGLSRINCVDEAFIVIFGCYSYDFYSKDGNTDNMPLYKSIYIDEIIYCKNKYIAGFWSKGDIKWSLYGNDWETINIPQLENSQFMTDKMIFVEWLDIIYILGVNYNQSETNTLLLQSQNLSDWTSTQENLTDVMCMQSQRKICKLYSDTLKVSQDGVNWDTYNIGGLKIAYSEQLELYAIINDSSIIISHNLVDWTETLRIDSGRNICAYKNGFIATNSNGQLYFTSNGTDWEAIDTEIPVHRLYYLENGDLYTLYNGLAYKAYGLNKWTEEPFKIFNGCMGICYSKQRKETLFYGEGLFMKNKRENGENIINRLSFDSDMGFNLNLGENELLLNKSGGNFICSLSYRQKYIGV